MLDLLRGWVFSCDAPELISVLQIPSRAPSACCAASMKNKQEASLNQMSAKIGSKREQEMQRINTLRQRLDAAKQAGKDRAKAEDDDFHKLCCDLLRDAERLASQTEEAILNDKRELEALREELQELIRTNVERTKQLEIQLNAKPSNDRTLEEKDLRILLEAEKERVRATEEERDLFKELAHTLQEEKNLLESSASERPGGLYSEEDKVHPGEFDALATHHNEILISHIKYLQRTFESDEALARALYSNLAADAIPNPNRCGYLTKQGGAVKSWKRRYFVLKDNFLFYYKRPRDDSPTGVIQLEGCSVEETPSEELDRKNCFTLRTPSRTWFFQADRQIEMDIWIDCISHAENWWTQGVGQNGSDGSQPISASMNDHQKSKVSRFRFSSYISSTPVTLSRIKGRADTDS